MPISRMDLPTNSGRNRDVDAERFQDVGAPTGSGKRSVSVFGHTNARACYYERCNGGDVKCGSAVATRSASVEQRFGSCIHSRGFLAHCERKAQQFVGSFPLGSKCGQERGNLRGSGFAAQYLEHGLMRVLGRKIFTSGNAVQIGQQHGGALISEFSTRITTQPNRDRKGVIMGLRPTKFDEDAKWGGPPGPHGSPWTRSSGFRISSAGRRGRRPRTRGSALLGVFNGALPRSCGFGGFHTLRRSSVTGSFREQTR